ncbi:hypothetical protein AB0N71_06750 [Pseudarthrobacter enclensis]|jgi:hypothetical protein|uniref:hypothetical protein n=1 Tax=Pseudarthrobacter enclensis TaxID=993070 RepID=UPI0034326DCA
MGTVFGVAWALMLAAGGAAFAAAAPDGGTAHAGQYLAGHVLLGVGIGQLAALLLRHSARLVVGRLRVRSTVPAAPGVPGGEAAAAPEPAAAGPAVATVAVLPVRPPASMARLRGRHAA